MRATFQPWSCKQVDVITCQLGTALVACSTPCRLQAGHSNVHVTAWPGTALSISGMPDVNWQLRSSNTLTTCVVPLTKTGLGNRLIHRRNVPYPPLFGLGVPYPHFSGHRWSICCHQRRSVEIKLHYNRFWPGLRPEPHHQRAHVLSWFPSMQSLQEGLQG